MKLNLNKNRSATIGIIICLLLCRKDDGNITFIDGKTDNIEYKYYPQPRDDGGTIHYYLINKDGNLYVINFVSKYDIKDFEEKVLNSIKF